MITETRGSYAAVQLVRERLPFATEAQVAYIAEHLTYQDARVTAWIERRMIWLRAGHRMKLARKGKKS